MLKCQRGAEKVIAQVTEVKTDRKEREEEGRMDLSCG